MAVVNQCIYCGGNNAELTDEHIVPFALNGRWVLKSASCKSCNKLTSSFERDVTRNLLLTTRTFHNFRTRRKNNRPANFPIYVQNEPDGIERTINIPIEEHGAVTILTQFPSPAYLSGARYSSGVDVIGQTTTRVGGEGLHRLGQKYSAKIISFRVSYSPVDFAKLFAKIAYGFSIARFGYPAFEKVYVLPSLLSKKDDIGMWVGCTTKRLKKRADIGVEIDLIGVEVHARVELFGNLEGALTYHVVVGRLSSNRLTSSNRPL